MSLLQLEPTPIRERRGLGGSSSERLADPDNVAQLSGVPLRDEVSAEFPVDGLSSHICMHTMIRNVMEPLLEEGESYCFRETLGSDQTIQDGSTVIAYAVTQNSSSLEEWERCVSVVRRYYRDAATGIISLKAEASGVPDICGLDATDVKQQHSNEPAFGLTVFGVLHDARPARKYVSIQMRNRPIGAESQVFDVLESKES